jgi:transcriptional regulator with XRE-family HTH domain
MEIDKDIELINLGKRVKEIRLSKNLTQFDLAVRVNKDQQSIHRLDVGKINPSYIYLLEVCQGLDIPVTEILNNKEL